MMKIRHRLRGQHVHAQVFVGPSNIQLAKAGDLVLREYEFADLREMLRNHDSVVFLDEDREPILGEELRR